MLRQLIANQMDEQETNKKQPKSRVRVAIRVRPMINRQSTLNQSSCIEYPTSSSIIIGKDKCFTFDHVFRETIRQQHIYEKCVKDLVLGCFQGYNAAVLAYGQTGSGKTYTMGTGATSIQDEQELGIIPRVIKEMFEQVELRKSVSKTIIRTSFIEIYNQQIIDLLSSTNTSTVSADPLGRTVKHSISKDLSLNCPTIRQEKDGSISLVNVTEETITDSEQMLNLLLKGGNNRSTSSTLMNDCSSRSHGIFIINIEQHPIQTTEEDEGFITAKFYFVDLAGSERAKKTGSSGLTFKQGININLGLLELGNVISALSVADKKQGQFITYRNSKLTRILQDSLGGNSNTYMIACISPAQSNYEESLNTMKYAAKAMNIKNKPVINRDPHSAQLNSLRSRIAQLQSQNRCFKRLLSQSGISIPLNVNQSQKSDPRTEFLTDEVVKMKAKIVNYQKKIEKMEHEFKDKIRKCNEMEIQNYELRRDRDRIRLKLQKYTRANNSNGELNSIEEEEFQSQQQYSLIEEYQNKIRRLECQLFDQQRLVLQLQEEHQKIHNEMQKDEQIILQKNKEIMRLKSRIKMIVNNEGIKKTQQSVQQNLSTKVVNSQQPLLYSTGTEIKIKDIYDHNANIQQRGNDDSSDDDELQQIQANQQIKQAEADFQAVASQHTDKLYKVESQIREQEQRLQALTEDQINLEYQLISQVKQEYHQKIQSLQKQKLFLIKQQEELAGYEKNPKLKQKIQVLQLELRDLRKKAKEQISLEKNIALQNDQIKKLANEIKLYKVQKIEINRKIKEDRGAFDKFRKQKIKEILKQKKENVRKEKIIRKLALDNKRKSMQMHKKSEQLDKFKRINEAIKSYNRGNKKVQKYNKLTYSSSYKHSYNSGNSLISDTSLQLQAVSEIQALHNKSTELIITQEQTRLQMDKYDKKILELENEIEKIINQEADLQLRIDRIEINANYYSQNLQISSSKGTEQEQLQSNLQQLKQRVSLIEQNIIFYQHRFNQLSSTVPNFYQQSDIIFNTYFNSIPKFQCLIRLLYQSLRHFVISGIINFKNWEKVNTDNLDMKDSLEKMREELAKNVNQYQTSLARLRQEMMSKYYMHLEEQQQQNNYYETVGQNLQTGIKAPLNPQGQRIEQREKKMFERKILDLTKTNRQLSADVEMWRRKCSIVQEKYHNANMRMAKDKFIGRPRDQELGVGQIVRKGGWNISGVHTSHTNTTQMLQQVNQMIQKIDNRKKNGNTSQDEELNQIVRLSQDGQFAKNKWECVMTIKASRTPILSMAIKQNLLVTSGTKSINVWDQETCKLVADLSNQNYLQGFVKSAITIPSLNLMAAACEKNVFIWDFRTYESVAVLRGHKDEVRCLHSTLCHNGNNNWLFSAGKGSSNGGSLLLWDLRMLDSQSPIDQKQKNSDIFAMTSHENMLYYGTRNHQVRRLTLENREVLTPFQPPHMDTVTSLTVLNNYLISGSKDKNLRLWSLENTSNNIRCTAHTFNDYINAVETDKNLQVFYAGSRDGQVKAAIVSNEQKIKFVGGIIAHTQSISSICSITQNPGLFATGSIDKTVKFWKPDAHTLEKLSNFNDNFY